VLVLQAPDGRRCAILVAHLIGFRPWAASLADGQAHELLQSPDRCRNAQGYAACDDEMTMEKDWRHLPAQREGAVQRLLAPGRWLAWCFPLRCGCERL